MLKLHVSSNIRIKQTKHTRKLEKFVEKYLIFDNPAYKSAIQYGKQNAAQTSAYIPKNIYAYEYEEGYMYITRGFLPALIRFLDKEGDKYRIIDKTITVPTNLKLKRIPTLRDYQVRATNKAIRRAEGVIKMPCGAGKTITLTNVIRRLQNRTLVLVHTNFIMKQWVEYFKEKYDYEPGIIQGETTNIKDITIAMIPTLYQRKLNREFLKMWGCVVVDETHRVPANSFFHVVNMFPAKYRFGTTATARRSDGLTNMIFATIGEIIYTVKPKTLAKQDFLTIPSVNLVQTGFYHRSNIYHQLISAISKNTARNELIVNNVYKKRKRFNLVLSNRIEHLENLVKLYSEYSDNYELIIGKMKTADRNAIIQRMLDGELHVIFATQLADEGLDIPNLDTIHLVYPTKADGVTEQRIGRIQRKKDTKPIVFDYVDMNIPKFRSFAHNRIRLYTDLELELEWQHEKKKSKHKKDSITKRQGRRRLEEIEPVKIRIGPKGSYRIRN